MVFEMKEMELIQSRMHGEDHGPEISAREFLPYRQLKTPSQLHTTRDDLLTSAIQHCAVTVRDSPSPGALEPVSCPLACESKVQAQCNRQERIALEQKHPHSHFGVLGGQSFILS